MPYGWAYCYPESYGGAPSDIELIWLAMRAMVGGEHGPGPIDGFEDSARQQDAIVLAGCERAIERAFLQVFPRISEDALPLWQRLLGSQGVDELDLRELLAAAWQAPIASTTPHLSEELTAISSQLSIVIEDEAETSTTMPGKVWAPSDPAAPTFGLRDGAIFPAFTSRDVLRVVYTLAEDEAAIPDRVERAVLRLLKRVLPAHQTWTLTSLAEENGGLFLLDGGPDGRSVLDRTAFGA